MRDLKAECLVLERSVLQGSAISKEELALDRPGGLRNPETGVRGWLRYFAVLHRRHATLMEQPMDKDADATLVAALRAEPVNVMLVGVEMPEAHGAPVIAVHPKSFESLVEIQKHDDLIHWLAVRYMYLREQKDLTSADDLSLMQRLMDELTYQYQLLCWIVTAPGPQLPFDPIAGVIPDIPEHIRTLDAVDLIAIARGHLQANSLRLRALRALLSPDKADGKRDRPTWALFFTNAAMELKTSPRALMRDYSLIEVLAMLQLHNVSLRDAHDVAKGGAAA